MKSRLSELQLARIAEIGQAIDIDLPLAVLPGGEVIVNEQAMEKNSEREFERGAGVAVGRAAQPRSDSASDQAARLGVGCKRAPELEGAEALLGAYPHTILRRRDHGIWIVAKSAPLGKLYDPVTFIVGYPDHHAVAPRGWAIWKTGPLPTFIGPRHTNFPDASICAFGPDDGAWCRDDGPAALIDLYSSWAVRHIYLRHFDRWPGRQHGISALYRRTEFFPDEGCGCGSGLRYGECHLAMDSRLSESEAQLDHFVKFGSYYGDRAPPKCIRRFVRSGWRQVPTFAEAF